MSKGCLGQVGYHKVGYDIYQGHSGKKGDCESLKNGYGDEMGTETGFIVSVA